MSAGGARGLLALGLALATCGCAVKRGLARADELLEDERCAAAARAYQDVLERRPEHPDALLGVARARTFDGEPDRALAPARAAFDAAVPGARLVLATALVQSGHGADSLALLVDAPDEDRAGRYPVVLLEACLAVGDAECIAQVADAWLTQPQAPTDDALAAWALARHGHLGEAHELASRAARAAPEDGTVQADAAAVFGLAGDATRARGAAATGRTFTPDRGRGWAVAAARRHAAGDVEGALRLLARCVALFPDEARYTWDLGRLYLEQDELALAIPLLARAAELPPFAEPLSGGARVVVEDRSHGLLPEEERRASLAAIYDDLLLARRATGDLAGVAETTEARARALRDTSVQTWEAITEAWLAAGDPASAVHASDAALARDAGSTSAHRAACRALAASGAARAALGHCRLVWQRTPGDVQVALLLGAVHEQQGDLRSAREVYAAALAAAPGDLSLTAAARRVAPR